MLLYPIPEQLARLGDASRPRRLDFQPADLLEARNLEGPHELWRDGSSVLRLRFGDLLALESEPSRAELALSLLDSSGVGESFPMR